MKTKKIYIIRHGETDYNRRGIVQGSGIDADLNSKGYHQAHAFYQAYKDMPFDKVYTSALKRTAQSVQLFLGDGLPHESLSGLNEINWGLKEGLPFTEEENLYYEEITEGWREGKLDRAIAGGESPLDVLEREKEALKHIMGNEGEDCILICMHGRALRIFLCLMLNYDLSQMDDFAHTNLGLYVVSHANDTFTIDLQNDASHLDGLLAT